MTQRRKADGRVACQASVFDLFVEFQGRKSQVLAENANKEYEDGIASTLAIASIVK